MSSAFITKNITKFTVICSVLNRKQVRKKLGIRTKIRLELRLDFELKLEFEFKLEA